MWHCLFHTDISARSATSEVTERIWEAGKISPSPQGAWVEDVTTSLVFIGAVPLETHLVFGAGWDAVLQGPLRRLSY